MFFPRIQQGVKEFPACSFCGAPDTAPASWIDHTRHRLVFSTLLTLETRQSGCDCTRLFGDTSLVLCNLALQGSDLTAAFEKSRSYWLRGAIGHVRGAHVLKLNPRVPLVFS
jgi:hypothetical protein